MSDHSARIINIEDFISKTLAIQSAESLLEFFTTYMKEVGYEYVAFFLLADNNQFTKKVEDGLLFFSFPQDWMDAYREKKHLEIDPSVEFSKTAPMPFKWMLDTKLQEGLSDTQMIVVNDMRDHGFTAGLVTPIYLPGGRVIHCSMASKKNKMDVSQTEMIEIGYLCHQIYNRYQELTRSEKPCLAITLSKRESDVLHWAAMGKSNTSIADILGISPHTVDTMMRRCFKKLNVSNRTSAVLKAVSNGLIAP